MKEFLENHDNSYKIAKPQQFYTSFSHYILKPDNQQYWELFNTRKYRISQEVISSRIMNHWQKENLLPIKCQEAGQKWRVFTLMDLVWIAILKELRELGLSIPIIKKVKKSIISSFNQCEYGEFEFYTALALFQKVPIEVLVFKDGTAEVATSFEIIDSREEFGLPTYISIPINGILQSIYKELNLQPIYDTHWRDLEEKEVTILDKIKSGDYDEITLIMQEEEIKIKATNRKKKDLYKIQNEGGDQDILVKMRNGKISHIEQNKIEKL